jgi:signal transduction histidine kinase
VSKREFDNLQPISTQGVPEEVRPLVSALNGLFERLETAFSNIRRFTGDAAHELRTPIAALKTHAQVAYRATDPVEARTAIAAAITGADRAGHVVEQMLTLARLDPESQVIKFEDVDLGQITESQIAEIANIALAKNIDLGLHCATQHMVKGKAALLSILVRNLTENAIACSPPGGKVDVSVVERNGYLELEVADNGPGIPIADRAKVFDRFYRGKNPGHSGTGLGLSIVKRIVELHHARIDLDTSHYGGLLVRVRLPTSASASLYHTTLEDIQVS